MTASQQAVDRREANGFAALLFCFPTNAARRAAESVMLYEALLGFFSMLMAIGGVFMIRTPERFITRANPTLELLAEHLPDGWTQRIVQGLGIVLVLFCVAFVYLQYVS
jgi:hypothetical protein